MARIIRAPVYIDGRLACPSCEDGTVYRVDALCPECHFLYDTLNARAQGPQSPPTEVPHTPWSEERRAKARAAKAAYRARRAERQATEVATPSLSEAS